MPAKFNILVAATIPLVPLIPLLACGGDSKSPDAHIVTIDSPGSGSNPGSAACTADASYGAANFGSGSDQFAQTTGSGNMHFEVWGGVIGSTGSSGMPDAVQLELYAGAGAFAGGDIRTGTFQLTGSDAQYATCGVCLRIFTDLHMQGSAVASTDDYLATAGSVTLTSVSGTTFSGTISNATFQHVNIGSDFTSTPVGDCTSTMSSGTMNATLTVGSAAFTGHIIQRPANVLTKRTF